MSKESKFFNIRPNEYFPLAMAATGTFTSIASVVLGRTLSDAILLSARPVINVANFFIFSSIALMAVSLIYFRLIRVFSAVRLNVAVLLLSAAGVVVSCNLNLASHTAILVCAIFLVTAPALGNIIVWNAIGDAFNARQGRRIFHLVGAASTLGGMVTGFVIPGFTTSFGFASLITLDAADFALMAIPVIVLHGRRRSERTLYSFTNEGGRSSKSLWDDFAQAFGDILRTPLLKNLSAIFFLTALATNIIDFILKYYLQTGYDREGIAIFYGYFNAVSNTFNLVVQLTFVSQFLTRFKTRSLFAVTPLVLLLFSVPFIFVYNAFCIIALRFMDVALRFTIQDAAREIAISSLPRLLRNRSKVIFKGVMNPLGGICAGVMLNVVSPLVGPEMTPLLLIPVNLVTLYFARDLNRFSSDHLFAQLQTNSKFDDVSSFAGLEPVSRASAGYDPELLADDSPAVRDATIDSILLDRSKDLKKHAEIRRFALELVERETRLAHAAVVLLDSDSHRDDVSTAHSAVEPRLHEVYDQAFFRMFKGLMVLYRRDMIRTIFQSLADTRASTRAQAIELLQLTLTGCPCSKSILILCDDFSQEEKMTRLNDEHMLTPEGAVAVLDAENDRRTAQLVPELAAMIEH